MKLELAAHDGWIAEPIDRRNLAVVGAFERITEQVEIHFADTPTFFAPSDIPKSAFDVLEVGEAAAPTHHDSKSVYLNTNLRVKSSGLVRLTTLVPEINFFDVSFPKNAERSDLLNSGRTIRIHSLFPDDRYSAFGKTKADLSFGGKLDAAGLLEPISSDAVSSEAAFGISAEFNREVSLTSVRAHGALSSLASWEIFRSGNDLDATIPLWVGLLVPKDAMELEFEMRLTVHSWRLPFGIPLETKWVSFKPKLPPASSPLATEELAASVMNELRA